MVDRLRVHGFYYADVVGNACDVREDLTDPSSAFPMLVEFKP